MRHALHSALLDTIRPDCLSLAANVTPATPRLPLYMLATRLGTMASGFTTPDRHFFVDLSASGSFANFLKHGYAPTFRGAPAINQFGDNAGTVRRLHDELIRLDSA
ncbi:hypothetical protein ACQPXS_03680 [Streptomyces sp. CA-142005]|uniref:hypothetical protein n=1 Tax=Streptomyces sp. CA-142005 TaxID=3240052 RepID=UPI003D934ACB